MRRQAIVLGLTLAGLLAGLAGCDIIPDGERILLRYDFADGAQEWEADISDYSDGQLETLEFESGIEALPDELDESGTGFFISSHNRSDDAFMFLKRRLTADDGIQPNQRYLVQYSIRLASNLPSGCAGIGGPPESVTLKAGASAVEPVPEPDAEDETYIGLSVDKGNQSQGGPAASVVGDGEVVTSSTDCEGDVPYETLDRVHTHDTIVESSDGAELWLLVGTDSGFEGPTGLYYLEINVSLHPVAGD